ncbi:MAG: RodZ domain-containing protein [Candidatus Limnocylindrales bacterium]|jgi:cytoskeletal protein RodZ
MTARDQARPSERRLAARQERDLESAAVVAPLPESSIRLGAMLHAARERKGVDLHRAERDTKIRARFLEALEESDFKALPGAVYTKGFLRNYALYLGLDPELVLGRWKAETGEARRNEPTIIAPRPLEAPRNGFTFSRGLLVAAVLTLVVLAFAGYIGLQLFRFAQPPGLTVAQAAVSETAPDADSTTLDGTASAGSTVAVEAIGQETYRVTADASGHWQQVVPLKKGRNDFTITATDPETGKDSEAIKLIVTVPVAAGPEAPTLTVTSPNDGTSFTNGAIPVSGTTTGQRVVVTATYVGPAPEGEPPAQAPADPEPQEMPVEEGGGAFSDAYQLAPGTWDLSISASGAADKTTSEMRRVTVAYTGVALIIRVRDARAWLKVWVDGELAPGYEGGRVIQPGKSVEFTGQESIEVRTGNSGATYFTVNGTRLGALGRAGQPETWLFAPPAEPEKTGRTN